MLSPFGITWSQFFVYTHIKQLHIITDSHSSQYRNQDMFAIMFWMIIPLFSNLLNFSCNYPEAGHRKGVADGIGGVLKRTYERKVATQCSKRV